MKKIGGIKLLALMVTMLFSWPLLQGANIDIPDFEIRPGETHKATVSLDLGEEAAFYYQGLQFDIIVPEGIGVDLNQTSLLAPLSGFSLNREAFNGYYRFIVYTQGNAIDATTDLMEVAFTAASDITSGKKTIQIANVTFASPKGQDIDLDNSSTTATVVIPPVEASAITLSAYDVTLLVQQTYQISAVVIPENAIDKSIAWSSDNTAVATVDQNGLVTAKAVGVANITATCGNVSATCVVTVIDNTPVEIPVASLTVSPTSLEFTEGDSPFQLIATILPEDATNKTLNWTTDNPQVATVNGSGLVTPVSPGVCVVTAMTVDGSNLSASCNVTVLKKQQPGPDEPGPGPDEPGPGPEEPDTPNIPSSPIIDGWFGNNNGTYVSAIKIREGNELGLGVNEPVGGYDNWSYLWTAPDNAEAGFEREITTTALLYGEAANSGEKQAVSENVYNVTVTNFNEEGTVFWEATYPTTKVSVYKRPQLPTQLLRKGDGSSCTFVVMMTPLSNEQILDLGYTYTYGYTDATGAMHELETTELRYCHTTSEIYNNSTNTFWVYSRWTYTDGTMITSGLRYLDGREDADFDASDIDGTRSTIVDRIEAENQFYGYYTVEGRFVGKEAANLAPGIYIMRYSQGSKKVVL